MSLKFSRLTRSGVRALSAGASIQEHGIIAEKMTDGDVRYSVNVMVDGQRIHRVIGCQSEGITREQAERAIESFRTRAREDRLDLPSARKRHRLVAEAAEEYLVIIRASGGRNLTNKQRHLRHHLVPFFKHERLHQLDERSLRSYRTSREGQGVKPATINRELATLSHLLSKAASKEWGWIKSDDRPAIPRAKEDRKHIEILTPEQSTRLISSAAADYDPDVLLFVLFGLNTAMRHSEILARRFDDVDWANCRLRIGHAKAGARIQPITLHLREALQERQKVAEDPEGWIFPSRTRAAKRPHRVSMAKHFRRIVVAAHLDPMKTTPHTMRHTGISRLVMAGKDIPTIQRISGHKTVQMVMHYVHLSGGHIDDAISVLGESGPGTVTPKLHTPGKRLDDKCSLLLTFGTSFQRLSYGADGGTRTRTPKWAEDFKSPASTGSATSTRSRALPGERPRSSYSTIASLRLSRSRISLPGLK